MFILLTMVAPTAQCSAHGSGAPFYAARHPEIVRVSGGWPRTGPFLTLLDYRRSRHSGVLWRAVYAAGILHTSGLLCSLGANGSGVLHSPCAPCSLAGRQSR